MAKRKRAASSAVIADQPVDEITTSRLSRGNAQKRASTALSNLEANKIEETQMKPKLSRRTKVSRIDATEELVAAVSQEVDKPIKPKAKPKKVSVKKEASVEKLEPEVIKTQPEEDRDIADQDQEGEEDVSTAASRPPPVHSDYLPLPWKGRLGYACLNTYLRHANPPVFSSRTCRIASILEHRHPLVDPSAPHHAAKNRPDLNAPIDIKLGQRYLEGLGKANAKDIVKMLRWNDKYGIKFLRLSSEIFPFASHQEYGYSLAPFVSEELAEAGRVAAELGHRLTTHPGQYTQLGSPRKEVTKAAVRDLTFHSELLSLLKLPPQQNRDAVMILHMGGTYGDKTATLDRFREAYSTLSTDIKARIVLENDDVSWHVHDLLPICEELNIPMVLDYHHHNILFSSEHLREGTHDITNLYPRIKATWTRKQIKQKMHYSEPCPSALTPHQRRKHSPRVATLPPCVQDMDLMIEAKDKEQAVFELMRTFRLPGWNTFNNIVPHLREDDDTMLKRGLPVVPEEERSMGGPHNRVYWPPTMEEWLRPAKRILKKKEPGAATPKKKSVAAAGASPAKPKKRKTAKSVPTPSTSDHDNDDADDTATSAPAPMPARKVRRAVSGRVKREVDYAEND
ncbi:MAG: UV-damage endonuclease [Vezdaea aestivalis]|nr:MAG: UV-damage endonuclease [Vezdaea aestivalis]